MDGIDASVVKSYDIRGTYPGQLNERFAYLLGRALLRVLPARRVAVGHDPRLSSPGLAAALAAGLREEGAQVGSLGLCPTELVYYVAGAQKGFELAVMITASHNPPEYNGFKVVKAGGEPVTGATGLGEACRLMQAMTLEVPKLPTSLPANMAEAGKITPLRLRPGRARLANLRVVVDPATASAGCWGPGDGAPRPRTDLHELHARRPLPRPSPRPLAPAEPGAHDRARPPGGRRPGLRLRRGCGPGGGRDRGRARGGRQRNDGLHRHADCWSSGPARPSASARPSAARCSTSLPPEASSPSGPRSATPRSRNSCGPGRT